MAKKSKKSPRKTEPQTEPKTEPKAEPKAEPTPRAPVMRIDPLWFLGLGGPMA